MKNNNGAGPAAEGFADLHMHSTASDGTLSPGELAVCAKRAGLRAAALTDHDTLSGLREFCSECDKIGIEGIAGVEISAKYKSEMHIVGLFVDYENEEFAETLSGLSRSRAERNYRMLKLFAEAGMDITEEDILSQKQDRNMNLCGRAHFAAALVKKGYAADTDDAFAKYIGKDKPFYAARKTYPPKETIEIIKKAGGAAVLAHPICITRDAARLREILSELKTFGLDGAECYYSTYDEGFSRLCAALCAELDLLPSGGSDFHGANKPDIPIGIVNGGIMTPYSAAENLKKRARG